YRDVEPALLLEQLNIAILVGVRVGQADEIEARRYFYAGRAEKRDPDDEANQRAEDRPTMTVLSSASLSPSTVKSYFRPPPKVLDNTAPGQPSACELGEPFALLIRRQTRLSRGVKGILVTGITVTTLLTSVATASAQNIFEALFGRLWNSPITTYADPNAAPLRSPEATRSEGGLAYCVRLCDGRYFPIQRHSGTTSAQTCSSMCPASATKIYNGSGIDHAVAPDGT